MKLADLPRRVVSPLGEWPDEEQVVSYSSDLERREGKKAAQKAYYERNRTKRLQAVKAWKDRRKAAYVIANAGAWTG